MQTTEAGRLRGLDELRARYTHLCDRKLSLDLTRGKPAPEQLALSAPLLTLPGPEDYRAADGTDCRNYGGPDGLPELRAIFSPFLQVPEAQLLALGNSSLELMHDAVVHALLLPVPDGAEPWGRRTPRFLCPVPGYDRHFAICAKFGIEMIPVPMNEDGPDLAAVEQLAGDDPTIKGMWCVPRYSNPTGCTYSGEVVRRLASMPTAAPDFRLFWDDAYAVHHLTERPAPLAPVLELCEAAGQPNRPLVFGSTSKVTMPGSGVAFFGASAANLAWFRGNQARRTIGPDKVNQLRHVRFLKDPAGVTALMERHRSLLAPKFAAIDQILHAGLGTTGLASWTRPAGGYFVCLQVPDATAAEIVRLAAGAGIALTPAGATHPHGHDPMDHTIRLAPTFPTLEELEQAMHGLVVCVQLAAANRSAAG